MDCVIINKLYTHKKKKLCKVGMYNQVTFNLTTLNGYHNDLSTVAYHSHTSLFTAYFSEFYVHFYILYLISPTPQTNRQRDIKMMLEIS